MNSHPTNKYQRKLIELKRNEKKKSKEERPNGSPERASRVRRKAIREYTKKKELKDELQQFV